MQFFVIIDKYGELMNFKKTIDDLLQLKFDKNSRIILLLLYALVMLSAISNQINLTLFIILFLILPVSIYSFVKYIFPDQNK